MCRDRSDAKCRRTPGVRHSGESLNLIDAPRSPDSSSPIPSRRCSPRRHGLVFACRTGVTMFGNPQRSSSTCRRGPLPTCSVTRLRASWPSKGSGVRPCRRTGARSGDLPSHVRPPISRRSAWRRRRDGPRTSVGSRGCSDTANGPDIARDSAGTSRPAEFPSETLDVLIRNSCGGDGT
jgi:hypothetical protein